MNRFQPFVAVRSVPVSRPLASRGRYGPVADVEGNEIPAAQTGTHAKRSEPSTVGANGPEPLAADRRSTQRRSQSPISRYVLHRNTPVVNQMSCVKIIVLNQDNRNQFYSFEKQYKIPILFEGLGDPGQLMISSRIS